MSYHNGTVWPHDNALIAYGFSRYGLQDLAVRVLTGLFEAGTYFDLHRMPELFCGFAREPGEGPTPYPVACAPQAWAAGAVFLLLQACLGLADHRDRAADRVHPPPTAGVPRRAHYHEPLRGRSDRRSPTHPARD